MSSIFLSDLHLSPERPQLTTRFTAFCAEVAPRAERVFILGDLFDVWIGDDQLDHQPFARQIAAQLASIAAAGSQLFIQHGNRDFLLGKRFALAARATLIPDPYIFDLYGVRTVLTHGDILCTDDHRYQEMRRRWRSPWRLKLIPLLPYALRRRIAANWRRQSQQEVRSKAAYIMDVNETAVAQLMRSAAATRMIHGHTHRPATHRLRLDEGKEGERIVLADWRDDNGIEYLEIRGSDDRDQESVETVQYKQPSPPLASLGIRNQMSGIRNQ